MRFFTPWALRARRTSYRRGAGRGRRTRQHPHGRGFARSIGAQKADDLAFWISKEIGPTAVLRAYLFVSSLNCDHVFLFLAARYTTFRTAPRTQTFMHETSCYELRRVCVNPSFEN